MVKLNEEELNEVAGGGKAIYGNIGGQLPNFDGLEAFIRDVDLTTKEELFEGMLPKPVDPTK